MEMNETENVYKALLGPYSMPLIREMAAEDLHTRPNADPIHAYPAAFECLVRAYRLLAMAYVISDDMKESIIAIQYLIRTPKRSGSSPPWSLSANNMDIERIRPHLARIKDLATVKSMEPIL
jgi:hypothetical protein